MVRLCITHLLGIRSRIDQLVSERPGHTKGLAPRRCLGRRDWVEYLGVSVNQRTRCDLNLDLALSPVRRVRVSGSADDVQVRLEMIVVGGVYDLWSI